MIKEIFEDFQCQWMKDNPEYINDYDDLTSLGLEYCIEDFIKDVENKIKPKCMQTVYDIKLTRENILLDKLRDKARKGGIRLEIDGDLIELSKIHLINGKYAGIEDRISYYTCGELLETEENKINLRKLEELANG